MAVEKSVFERIAESRASGGGTQITDGKYSFTIVNLLMEKKYTGTCFIAELLVNSSEAIFDDVTPNKPGTRCSYVVNLDGAGKLSAPGNIKAFVLAVMGETEGESTPEDLEKTLRLMTGPEQLARGIIIESTTYRKYARAGKNAAPDAKGRPPMVMQSWRHVPQTDTEVKKRRAELG